MSNSRDGDLVVIKVDGARLLLAEARDAGQAKQVADLACAAEVYARRQKLSEEAIAYATAVKIDAMTLMGQFLKQAPKNTGTAGNGRPPLGSPQREPPKSKPPTLSEVGIGKRESSNAQALADLKEKDPQLHEQIRAGKKTTSQGIRVVMRGKKTEKLKEMADAAPPQRQASWQINHADCQAGLGAIGPGTVRLAFADPPYNQGVNYGGGGKADNLPDHEYLAWCGFWMDAVARTLTPDGSFWVLISDEYADEFARLLRLSGLKRKQWLIWYESFGVNHHQGFGRSSRHLLWYVKDPKRFVFNETAVLRPSDREAKYGDRRAQPGGRTWDSVWGFNPPIPRLVDNAKERLPEFPTQLPLALLRPIVGCASEPGDLVLDPFCGSGTTGEAAIESGRQFIGIEKQARFVELATLRLKGVKV